MAYQPTSGRDPLPPGFPGSGGVFAQPGDVADASQVEPPPETDLADLTSRFAASGPGLSPELSAELALEIVLHEIVEQACLATGATGAAIVLERDGEMVCRASSGPTAPELGARLDGGSGLSGECIRTQEMQRCEDAWADPRADREASRQLGVRSVLVYPLLREKKMVGILEALSSRAAAFGERDERTLEALRERVLKNLDRSLQPIVAPVAPSASDNSHEVADPQLGQIPPQESHRAIDIVTWALGVVVLGCAVWVGLKVTQFFEPRRAGVQPTPVPARSSTAQGSKSATGSVAGVPAQPNSAAAPLARSKAAAPGAGGRAAPEGSLLVYENGKEVFRMAPTPAQTTNRTEESGVHRASSVESESVVNLSPDAAENSLVYRVEPEYPEEARQQKLQGAVVLDARIKPDGTVENLKVLNGQPLLAEAAVAAVRQWRFRPQTVNGRQVEMQTRITMRFTLPSD